VAVFVCHDLLEGFTYRCEHSDVVLRVGYDFVEGGLDFPVSALLGQLRVAFHDVFFYG